MDTRTIYRVEDADGAGPYGKSRLGSYRHEASGGFDLDKRHPMPQSDYTLWELMRYARGPDGTHARDDWNFAPWVHFGFSSIAQLEAWFDPRDRAALHAQGFRVAVYEAPKGSTAAGRTQAIFCPEMAERADTRPLA
jgi:hypothetical protein